MFTTIHHASPNFAYALREIAFALRALGAPATVTVTAETMPRRPILRVWGPRCYPA